MTTAEKITYDTAGIKPGKKLENLDYENEYHFYAQIKTAVAYLDAHFGLSEEDEKLRIDVIAIMKGSKNPLDENQIAIGRARTYGVIDGDDIDKMINLAIASKYR